MSWVQTKAGRVNTAWPHGTEADVARWNAMLARAHGSPASCCCNKTESPIAIRRLSATRYTLARYGERGLEHSDDCDFYGDSRVGGGHATRYEGAVSKRDDGSLSISLAIPLGAPRRDPDDVRESGDYKNSGHRPRVVQGKMTLLGLLFLLWEHARLNRWHATADASRTENHISAFLGKAAEEMHVARSALSDQILCLSTSPTEGQRKFAWSRLFKQRDAKRALVLIGQFGAIGSLAQRWTAALAPYNFRTELPAEVVARTERSYRRVLGASGRRVFIAVVRPQAYKTIVEYIAVMQTSEPWIPVDSSYELSLREPPLRRSVVSISRCGLTERRGSPTSY